ncbi:MULTISPECIES: entry exclusion protein TrbK [Rhizobiaceae]|uniref:Entry exclusion protein TrbK n=1 Tax=Rhizobium tropici TaxID=398 RepID=A0A6P1C3W0_RHITR|nr:MULTISPECIES: entry exclusion protein TrbK [Rhizobiaceae]AEI89693.1 probable transfer trbK protein [Sinorhizobium fredii GR64]AGB73306.1 conjugal transfer exclusion protein TrbK [Rhizobium tropici CIAT 899]MBB4243598.1 Ti type entry exclusion protein TrbK [Rhizobium tropici]MBB5595496.1 Ti type entry exclusion protein TrbK [Rhizobium tropici]MBB6493946.1 Ti type entry exclusion protein TrbK [Rhizobium tropici]
MVRTKLILLAIAALVSAASAGIWLLISVKQVAQERRDQFFGTSKKYPTSGGEKMKVEW